MNVSTNGVRFSVLLPIALVLGGLVAVLPLLVPTGPANWVDTSALGAGNLASVGLVFVGGLLTALTPCVYPLIPVTVSIFGAGARSGSTKAQSFVRTFAFVLGLAAVFTGLGVAAAKGGQAFGSLLGRPEVALVLAALLALLASSLFGAFELELPPRIAQRLSTVGGGGTVGAFLMGGASGFVAAPCTGPVLTALLTLVAKNQNPLLGGTLLFVYALGMGLPFVLIGAFAVRLPKSGVWMEWVKSALGVILLAMALSYARDAFPWARAWSSHLADAVGARNGALIGGALAVVGVLVGAVHLSFHGDARERAIKTLGVLLVVSALFLRLAALQASSSLWTWRVRFGAPQDQLALFDAALAQAVQAGKPVLIDFAADWCAACKELDRETYSSPMVVEEGRRFFTIKVDGTNEPDAVVALYKRYGVEGLPTIAFVGSNGTAVANPRVTGFVPADEFLVDLHQVR